MTGLELARLWMLLRPVQRIRQWRTKRKMQSWAEHHLDEVAESFNVPPDEGFMSEVQQSVLRSILKVVAGALAAKGLIDVGEAASLQIVLETLAAGIIGAIGFVLSHRKHTAA